MIKMINLDVDVGTISIPASIQYIQSLFYASLIDFTSVIDFYFTLT